MNPLDQIESMGGAISPAINERYNPGVQSFGMSDTEVPSYGLFDFFKKKKKKFGEGGIFSKRNSHIGPDGMGNILGIPKSQATIQPAPAPTPAPTPSPKTYRDFDWSDYSADRLTRDVDERDQYYDNFKRDRDFWGSYYNRQPQMAQPINNGYDSFGGRPYQIQPMPYRDPYVGGGGGIINRFFNKNRDRMRTMPMSNLYDYDQPNYGAYVNPDGSENDGGKFMDFQDRDNDGYDDRYQLGPGHKPGTEYIADSFADKTSPEEDMSPYGFQAQPRPAFGGGGFLGQLLGGLLGNFGGMASRLAPSPFSQPLGGLFNRQQSVQPPRKRNFGGLSSLFAKMF